MFRKVLKNEKPTLDTSLNVEFVDAVSELVKTPIYNEKGDIVSYRRERKIVRKPIPIEILENRGIDCSMFSIENAVNSGISLKQLNIPQITSSLEQQSYVSEQVEDFVNNNLTEKDFE